MDNDLLTLMIASAVLILLLLIVLAIAVFFYYRARRRNKFKPGTVKQKRKAPKAPLLMSHDDHNGKVTRVKTETTSTFTTNTQSQRPGPVPATQISVDAAAKPIHDHYQQGVQLDSNKQPSKQPPKPAAKTCTSNPKTPKKSKSHVSSRRQWQRKLMTGREGPAAKHPEKKAMAESKIEKAEREQLASTFANYNALIGEENHFVPINLHKGSIERDYPVPESEREQLRERKHNILKAYRLKAKSAKKKGKRAQYGTPSKSTGSEVRCVTSNESVETTTGKASTSPRSVR